MYSSIPYILIAVLLGFVALHSYMSVRFGYDWIGSQTRKVLAKTFNSRHASVTDLYNIPAVPYMDRFGTFTKIPKMKENVRY
jgi:hypothetical protein